MCSFGIVAVARCAPDERWTGPEDAACEALEGAASSEIFVFSLRCALSLLYRCAFVALCRYEVWNLLYKFTWNQKCMSVHISWENSPSASIVMDNSSHDARTVHAWIVTSLFKQKSSVFEEEKKTTRRRSVQDTVRLRKPPPQKKRKNWLFCKSYLRNLTTRSWHAHSNDFLVFSLHRDVQATRSHGSTR